MRQRIVTLWAMYRKDLREIRGIGLALVAYGVVVNTIYFGLIELDRIDVTSFAYLMVPFRELASAMPYVFPTLLAYLLFQQRRDKSHYLEQSLPVWRGMTVVTAWLALMTVVIAYSFMTHLLSAAYLTARLNTMNQSLAVTLSRPELNVSLWKVVLRATFYSFDDFGQFIHIAHLSGIVCLASGIASPFAPRRWGWYWTAFSVTIAVIYGVPALMARFELEFISQWWMYTILLSSPVLVLTGAWLSGRSGEV